MKNIIGSKIPSDFSLPLDSFKKYDKIGAVKIKRNENGDLLVTDYKKCIDKDTPRVFTIESVTTEGIRLFQVGSYENPLLFRENGQTITKFRSRNWINWQDYMLLPIPEEEDV